MKHTLPLISAFLLAPLAALHAVAAPQTATRRPLVGVIRWDGYTGIPRGNDDSNGNDCALGEGSNSQLNSAISGTSNNTDGLSRLDTGFADPDLEALRQKMNKLILNGRR